MFGWRNNEIIYHKLEKNNHQIMKEFLEKLGIKQLNNGVSTGTKNWLGVLFLISSRRGSFSLKKSK